MSTDKVAVIKPEQIESFEELFEKADKKEVIPIIFKDFYYFDFLRLSPHTSKYASFFQIILNSNQDETIISFDPKSQNSLAEFADKLNNFLSNDKYALSMEKLIFTEIGLPVLCVLFKEMGSKVYLSKNTYADGILTIYTSKSLEPEVRRFSDYRMQTVQEFDLPTISFTRMVYQIIKDSSGNILDNGGYKCIDRLLAGNNDVNEKDYEPKFLLASLRKSCYFLFSLIILASTTFVVEILFSRFIFK